MDDLLLYCFDFSPLQHEIDSIMQESHPNISMLTIKLIAIPPTPKSDFIQEMYVKGKIKSYQLKEICTQIYTTLKGALNSNLEESLNLFTTFKDNVKIRVITKTKVFKIRIRIKNLSLFDSKLIYAIITHFNMDVMGYCESLEALLFTHSQNQQEPHNVLEILLEKFPLADYFDFFTLQKRDEVIEFYRCPEVKEILFKYFFPGGPDSDLRTEITIDMLREETFPQKRRKIYIPTTGDYINFHDAINPYTTHAEFLKLVEENNILDFYPSVRLVGSGDVTTMLIDIDISGFLKASFSRKIIWEFTLTLVDELIFILTEKLHLPRPLVLFSGSKGVHLLYKVSPHTITTEYEFVNYWELYLLPGQKTLMKNESSILRSKYTFSRTIVEAIILYTIENLSIEKIPKTIREKLGIIRTMDFFKLSPFDQNKVGVLLDSSSNNGSVHRIFSIHPTSGLVSIPITDPKTNQIAEKFLDYEVLKEEASVSRVIENIQQGYAEQYYQYPPILTRRHIENLLEPTKLLPVISTIIRFSDRWVVQRSTWSYKFWYEMYQLNNFYAYCIRLLLNAEHLDGNIGNIYFQLRRIISQSVIKTKKLVKKAIDNYFFAKTSYQTIKHRLDAYRDLEFFYCFKFEDLKEVRPHNLHLFLDHKQEQKEFLRKFRTLFNIATVLFNGLFEDMIGYQLKDILQSKKLKPFLHMYIRLKILRTIFQNATVIDPANVVFQTQLNLIRYAVLFNILVKFVRGELIYYHLTKRGKLK